MKQPHAFRYRHGQFGDFSDNVHIVLRETLIKPPCILCVLCVLCGLRFIFALIRVSLGDANSSPGRWNWSHSFERARLPAVPLRTPEVLELCHAS
jgi:hypothetical protein